MPRVPAALILAACLFLAAPALAAGDPQVPSASPDKTASVSPDSVQAVKPAPPAHADDDGPPPPFMVRPKLKPQPLRQDLTYASKPGPRGFRGLDWGAALPEVQTRFGLAPVKEPVTLKDTFQRPDELLKLGLADLRTIAYYFPKGRFAGVGITFEGEANFFLIKDHLIELYGPGRQVGDRYGWTWKDCNIDLRLKSGAGELRYTYEP